MRKTILLVFVSFVLFGGIAEATNYGNFNFVLDASMNGVGDVWVVSTANPGYFLQNAQVLVVGSLLMPTERRSKRVFDSFDNTVGNTTVADNTYFLAGPYTFSFRIPKNMLQIGFDFFPILAGKYSYENTERDEFYRVILTENETVDLNGFSFTPNIGFKYKWIGIGGGVRIIRGNDVYNYEHYTDTDTTINHSNYSIKGNGYYGGLTLSPIKNLTIGFVYGTAIKISKDTVADINYPEQYAFGIDYFFPGPLPAKIYFQLSYIPWSVLTKDGVKENLDNVESFHFGVEHLLTSNILIRLGYMYSNIYANSSLTRGTYTFGLGYRAGLNELGFGFNFSGLSYKGDELNLGTGLNDLYFDETSTLLSLTYKRGW